MDCRYAFCASSASFDLGPCLFFGDNLDVLPAYIADETVDLVYLDPPFNSQPSYNAIFKHVGRFPGIGPDQSVQRHMAMDLESESNLQGRLVEAGRRRVPRERIS